MGGSVAATPGLGRAVGRRRLLAGLTIMVVLLPVVTVALVRGDHHLQSGGLHLLYLLVVVVVAAVGGLVPGLLSAGIAFALVAWFFATPCTRWPSTARTPWSS